MKIESETKEKELDKTTKKENEKSSRKSPNFFINYKDLFLIQEPEPLKEKEEKKEKEDITLKKKKNEEDLSYLKQLYTFPEITNDSFKNKEYKFVLQSNKNIRFHDEYTAKYIGKGVSKIDYGTVQTEKEITNIRPVFYFEVFIKDDGKDCDIWIGIGEKEITEKCLSLGSTSRSYGYHSKSKSHNNKKVNKYGENFVKGDTIGCGIDLENKSIFYTKNGKFLDYAFKDINFELGKGYLYPSISMHTLNSEVVINFGKDNYKYDIKQYYENNLGKKYNEIQKIEPKFDEMDSLVKEYLFHEGYLKTLKSMLSNIKEEKKENKEDKKENKKEDNLKENNELYLNIENNMKIDEIKNNENRINIGDNNNNSMEIEEEEYNYEKDNILIENILKLLPNNNKEIKEKNKVNDKEKDKKEEKKDEKKEEKKEDKKEDKKEEKKEEKKEDKKEEKKKEEKKEEKKKEEKKEKKEDKMEIEIKEKTEKEKEKEKQERKENLKKLINFRGKMMNYFINNEFDKAISLLKEIQIKEKEEIKKKLYFNIMIMKYFTLLKNEDNYIACFELLDSFEKEYWDKYKILLYENSNFKETKLFSVQNLATLVSQPDIINSNDAFFLNEKQLNLIKNQMNSLLFEMFNFSPMSNLGKVFAHLEYMNGLYIKIFNCNQELNLKLD